MLKEDWLDENEYIRVLKSEACNLESRQSPLEQYGETTTTALNFNKPKTQK